MKPFSETKVGKFLGSKGVNIVLDAAEIIGVPGAGIVNNLKDKITNHPTLSPEDKITALSFLEEERKVFELELMDKESARNLYEKKNDMADIVVKRVVNWNLPIAAVLIFLLVYCTVVLKDNVLLALISSSIGAAIQQLFSERQTIINFFFGSSKGSKDANQALTEIAKS